MFSPKAKKIAAWVLPALAAYAAAGFLALPLVARPLLESRLSDALGRKVTIQRVAVNPFALSVGLQGLDMTDEDGRVLFSAEEAWVDVGLVRSVGAIAPVISGLRLVRPYVAAARNPDGSLGLAVALPGGQPEAGEAQPGEKTASGPPRFALGRLLVVDGLVLFFDRASGVDHRVEALNLDVAQVSSLGNKPVEAAFSFCATVNRAAVGFSGTALPFDRPPRVEVAFQAGGVDVLHYLAYAPLPPGLGVDSARVNVRTRTLALAGDDPRVEIQGEFSLAALAVTGPDGEGLFLLSRLDVELGPSQALAQKFFVKTVSVQGPRVFLSRRPGAGLNLPEFGAAPDDNADAAPDAGEAGPPEFMLSVDELILGNGLAAFSDLVPEPSFLARVTSLELSLKGFSTVPGQEARFRVLAATEREERLDLSGAFTLKPLEIHGTASLTGLPLAAYAPYYLDRVGFTGLSGTADASASFSASLEGDEPQVRLWDGALELRGLSVSDESGEPVAVEAVNLSGARADLSQHTAGVGEFSISRANLLVQREADGAINLANLFLPPDAGGEPSPGAGPEPETSPAQATDLTPTAWTLTLDRARIQDSRLRFQDRAAPGLVDVTFSDVTLLAENFSTQPGSQGSYELSLNVEPGGRISVQGAAGPEPLALTARARVEALPVGDFLGYAKDAVDLAALAGSLDLSATARADLSGSEPAASISGDLSLAGFSARGEGEEPLVSWEDLSVTGLRVELSPLSVRMDRVDLVAPQARLTVGPDGKLNLAAVFPASEETAGAPVVEEAAQPLDVEVGEVAIRNGLFRFTDQSMTPDFHTELANLEGSVTGLSSRPGSRASVRLEAMVDSRSPVLITGKVNPLSPDLSGDIAINLADLQMSPFSPLSGKFLGRALEKGRLTLGLEYGLDGSALSGKNRLFFHQFTLGGDVESPDALSLPLDLALNLLRDTNGDIKLDVPVSGDLDDPKFSIGGIVLTIIKNAVLKVATAPFSLLGSLVGGWGDELGYVEFAPGSPDILSGEREKLDALARALVQRPGLSLEIRGLANPGADAAALRQQRLELGLKEEKARRILESGMRPSPPEEITILPGERPELVLALWVQAREEPSATRQEARPGEPTPGEAEAALLESIPVSRQDLLDLAGQRAREVSQHLTASAGVPPNRLLVKEPDPDGGENRAAFELK